jgi:hypothetical protein
VVTTGKAGTAPVALIVAVAPLAEIAGEMVAAVGDVVPGQAIVTLPVVPGATPFIFWTPTTVIDGGWGKNQPVVLLCQTYTPPATKHKLGVEGLTGQLAARVDPAAAPKNTTCPDWARTLKCPQVSTTSKIKNIVASFLFTFFSSS